MRTPIGIRSLGALAMALAMAGAVAAVAAMPVAAASALTLTATSSTVSAGQGDTFTLTNGVAGTLYALYIASSATGSFSLAYTNGVVCSASASGTCSLSYGTSAAGTYYLEAAPSSGITTADASTSAEVTWVASIYTFTPGTQNATLVTAASPTASVTSSPAASGVLTVSGSDGSAQTGCALDASGSCTLSIGTEPSAAQTVTYEVSTAGLALGVGSFSIAWAAATTGSSPTVSLAASTTSPAAGASFTLTATASSLTSTDGIDITSGGTAVGGCAPGTNPCTSAQTAGASGSVETLVASIIDNTNGTVVASSAPLTVTVASAGAIGTAAQTIAFTGSPPSKAPVGGTYTPMATSTSGLPVALTIDSTTSSVCSMLGGVVTFSATGTCEIDANQAGDTSWAPATQVQQSVSVVPATVGPGEIIVVPGSSDSSSLTLQNPSTYVGMPGVINAFTDVPISFTLPPGGSIVGPAGPVIQAQEITGATSGTFSYTAQVPVPAVPEVTPPAGSAGAFGAIALASWYVEFATPGQFTFPVSIGGQQELATVTVLPVPSGEQVTGTMTPPAHVDPQLSILNGYTVAVTLTGTGAGLPTTLQPGQAISVNPGPGAWGFSFSTVGSTGGLFETSMYQSYGSASYSLTAIPVPPVLNTPTLITHASVARAVFPTTVSDAATLSGATSLASAPITTSVYRGSDGTACVPGNLVGTPETAAPATDGNGSYSATFSSLAAGSYEFQGSYPGDPGPSGNSSATSVCGSDPLVVSGPVVVAPLPVPVAPVVAPPVVPDTGAHLSPLGLALVAVAPLLLLLLVAQLTAEAAHRRQRTSAGRALPAPAAADGLEDEKA